ncbi:hypothetical protein CONPUDRAFT_49077 [Coniophora puteana RWD-64-598 SS2]|uniref:Proteasome assembly chaperone 3 n=1 Tax=Coniophora puteana (strain RWD-64-598) TaxID=741705 RepID=A0A5M3N2M8_CONPW|nr:uncharacterized protein CONPUDRAFT_49077 [Coniophora puteana RWD-64-598 SS2]EIW85125.1 hypothetical protein CONPUDRAFT_49077 [Coniophora puteana RWD-64-598 SS2]
MLASGQIAAQVNGTYTEISLQTFADRVIVLITQLGKVGNLTQASIPQTTPLPSVEIFVQTTSEGEAQLPTPPAAIQLTPLLGYPPSNHLQTLHALYVSHVATLVWMVEVTGALSSNRRSVIVGVALQPQANPSENGLSSQERETFLGIMDLFQTTLSSTLQK